MVDPPGLQRSPGNEAHLHAFATEMIGEDGVSQTRYLHTSPEFSMKKLLAAGETRIASFGHVWRNRERTGTHHPEFTMIEWYRAREPYTAVMDDCIAMMRIAAETAGTRRLGLVVDHLEGQQDIVIKPLGSSLRHVRGFAGAAQLGDQRVGLVLDGPALVEEVMAGEVGKSPLGLRRGVA